MRIAKLVFIFSSICPISAFSADFSGLLIAGPAPSFSDSVGSLSEFTMDSSDDVYTGVFQCPEAATITKVAYYLVSKTGTPATYKVTLEGVDASNGRANATDKGGGSATATNFTPGTAGAQQIVTLGNSYACARGEYLAITIRHSTGTINGSNYINVGSWWGTGPAQSLPYVLTFANGTTETRYKTYFPLAFGSASRWYGYPLIDIEKTEFTNGDNPDEYGLAFSLDCDWVDTFSLNGIRGAGRAGAPAMTFEMYLHSNSGSPSTSQSIAFDTDAMGTQNENGIVHNLLYDEVTLATLDCETEYYAGLKATADNARLNFMVFEVGASDQLSAFPGGTAWKLYTRNNASGAITVTNTKRPLIDLHISDFTVPSGGSSGGSDSQFNRGFN